MRNAFTMSPNTRSPCLRHKQKRGEVAPSYGDGGVMGHNIGAAHDPSVPRLHEHLPGFAREERFDQCSKSSVSGAGADLRFMRPS